MHLLGLVSYWGVIWFELAHEFYVLEWVDLELCQLVIKTSLTYFHWLSYIRIHWHLLWWRSSKWYAPITSFPQLEQITVSQRVFDIRNAHSLSLISRILIVCIVNMYIVSLILIGHHFIEQLFNSITVLWIIAAFLILVNAFVEVFVAIVTMITLISLAKLVYLF